MPRRLLIALLVLLAAPAAAPAPAPAATTQVMTFEAPRELLDDRRRDATLDEIRSLGVERVRALVYWRDFTARPSSRSRPEFDTTDPDAYPAGTWDVLDRLVAATATRSMTLQLTLTGPVPTWATAKRRGHLRSPNAKWFGRWVEAVARRYGGHVDVWSVWNEPNHPEFFKPQYKRGVPYSPRRYRKLYQAAERALHGVRGGARDVVLFGETAPIGNENVVAPLAFLRGAMCLDSGYEMRSDCAKLRIDGYAHHAYSRRNGPLSRYGTPDEVSLGTLDRLERALDRAARAGAIDRKRGIYLTEYGIQSKPDPIAGVSLAKQAEFLAIAEHMAYVNPRVKAFSQYLMRDDEPRRGVPRVERFGGFETGLRRSSGRKKPAYRGFILPLRVIELGSSDVLWGRVRPARRSVEVTIERKVGTGSWVRLTALDTSSSGVFGLRTDHRSGVRYRVKWRRPGGGTVTGPAIRPY